MFTDYCKCGKFCGFLFSQLNKSGIRWWTYSMQYNLRHHEHMSMHTRVCLFCPPCSMGYRWTFPNA